MLAAGNYTLSGCCQADQTTRNLAFDLTLTPGVKGTLNFLIPDPSPDPNGLL